MTLHDIVINLQRHVLPLVQQWVKELERDFENAQIGVYSIRTDSDNKYIRSYNKYSYEISIKCLKKDATHLNSGDLILLVYLSQYDDISKPTINAVVDMFVDDERYEDLHVHRISELFPYEQEPKADKTTLKKLENSLPVFYQALRQALASKEIN